MATDYPALWAFGKMVGEDDTFLIDLLKQAREEEAPSLAACKEGDIWITLDQIINPATQGYFIAYYPKLAKEAGWIYDKPAKGRPADSLSEGKRDLPEDRSGSSGPDETHPGS